MARSRSSGRKADLRWTGGQFSFSALAAGSAAGTIVSAGNTSQTLMRTRGEILCYVDAAGAPGVFADVAVGMIVMPGGSGTTVTSSPITDPDAPWFFYERFSLGYEERVTDVVSINGIDFFRKAIDVKAMRVIRPDREIQVVIEQASIQSALSVNCVVNSRFLLGD